MADLINAFPWLARLRPVMPIALPALAIVLLIASSLDVAGTGIAAVVSMVFCCVALGLALVQPWVALVCTAVGSALTVLSHSYNGYGWVLTIPTAVLAILATRPRGPVRWVSLAVAASIGIAMGYAVPWIGFLVPPTLMLGAWAIGFAAGEAISRVRAVQRTEVLTEQLDASQLELAVTAERERVAQEVHDVVAHSLAVILAQAEGARALSTKRPAAMTDALDKIAAQSRSALLDVRGIVDGLTGGAEPPQPTIGDLPELLRGVEESGVVVRSTNAGEPRELGPAQQTAVYRIVQEGATNAIRHRGRGSGLDIVLDWRGPGLSIQLVSSGTGDAVPAPGAGRGIPGMTDRARIAGGWLAAGEDESGDHRITAFVPFRPLDTPASPATRGAEAGVPA